jgi:WD40 repeat protein
LQLKTIELDEHESAIREVAFSPDGSFATSSDDHTVRLWNPVESRASRCLRGHTGYTSGLAFNPDGTIIASSSPHEVILTAILTGEEIARFPIPVGIGQALNLLQFNSEGSKLAGAIRIDGEPDGWIALWDVTTGHELISRRYGEHIQAISFGSDDSLVADTYEASDNVRVYRQRNVVHEERTIYLDIKNARGGGVPYRSPTGRLLVLGQSCYGSSVEMFDLTNRMALYNLKPQARSQPSLSFSPDGAMLAWGNGSPLANCDDYRITVHDAHTGDRISELDVIGSAHSCSFSPDGRLLCAVSMSEPGVWFWDFPSGRLVAKAPYHRHFGLFSPNGRWFVSAHAVIHVTDLSRLD